MAIWTADRFPQVRSVLVSTQSYYEAGASEAQELAFAIGTGLEYLRVLLEGGLELPAACEQLAFSFSVGCELYLNVAKLRANGRI